MLFESTKQLEAILPHLKEIIAASNRSDFEVCGLIVGGDILHLENISDTPRVNFRIDPASYVDIFVEDSSKITACFHSHVIGGEKMSILDRETSDNSTIPFLIYSTISRRFSLYLPKSREIIYFRLEGI